MCEVSHQSVKWFRRRFLLNVLIFNPIWPPNYVTDDVINLILHSHRVVDQTYEVSDFSDEDFDSTDYG